jgi:hypothetical protein
MFVIGFLLGGMVCTGGALYWLASTGILQSNDETLRQGPGGFLKILTSRISQALRTQQRLADLQSQVAAHSERIAALEIERSRDLLDRIRGNENEHPSFLLKQAVTDTRSSVAGRA